MDQKINLLEQWINEPYIDEDQKKDFISFKAALEDGSLNDHMGRYVLLRNGCFWNQTFGHPEDVFEDSLNVENFQEFLEHGTLYQVPAGTMDTSQSCYGSYTMSVLAEEPKVPIKLIAATASESTAFRIFTTATETEQFESNTADFLVDTGTFDTSCISQISEGPLELERKKKGVGNCIVTYKWKLNAFWGSKHVAV